MSEKRQRNMKTALLPATLCAALSAALAPAALQARQCDKDPVIACAPGFVWDADKMICVEIVSG